MKFHIVIIAVVTIMFINHCDSKLNSNQINIDGRSLDDYIKNPSSSDNINNNNVRNRVQINGKTYRNGEDGNVEDGNVDHSRFDGNTPTSYGVIAGVENSKIGLAPWGRSLDDYIKNPSSSDNINNNNVRNHVQVNGQTELHYNTYSGGEKVKVGLVPLLWCCSIVLLLVWGRVYAN